MKQKFVLSVLNILMLCVVIAAVSIFFVNKAEWMGLVVIILALLCIISLCQSLKILNCYLANYLEKFLMKFKVYFFGDCNLILVCGRLLL